MTDMKNNMGTTDRILRAMSFILILVLFLTNILQGTLAYLLLGITGIFLVTSLINFCPLYSIFGISTKKRA